MGKRLKEFLVSNWIAIVAVIMAGASLWLDCKRTFPETSIQIIDQELCIDNRYLEDQSYKDSIYLCLRVVNNSPVRPIV